MVTAKAVLTYTGAGTEHATLHLHSLPADDAAMSPDGKLVALVLGGCQLVVVRAGSSNSRVRQLLAVAGLRELSWSPNGR